MRKALKVFNRLVAIVWLLSAVSLDSVSEIPTIVCIVTTLYLAVFMFMYRDRVEEVL